MRDHGIRGHLFTIPVYVCCTVPCIALSQRAACYLSQPCRAYLAPTRAVNRLHAGAFPGANAHAAVLLQHACLALHAAAMACCGIT